MHSMTGPTCRSRTDDALKLVTGEIENRGDVLSRELELVCAIRARGSLRLNRFITHDLDCHV